MLGSRIVAGGGARRATRVRTRRLASRDLGGTMAAAPARPKAHVVLLGCGGVGRAFIDLALRLESEVAVAAVADSSSVALPSDPASPAFTRAALLALSAAKATGSPLAAEGASVLPRDQGLERVLGDVRSGRVPCAIFADCSAADTGTLLASAVAGGAGVALANKKPLTGPIAEYDALMADPRRVRVESTVGAGTPVNAAVRRLVRAGDAISRVAGAFSGTLGFVMSGLEAGKTFSDVVREAKDAGYTEPDPRDDLGGTDVARKALILARATGARLEMSDVAVESLYPPELAQDKVDVPTFMRRLVELDASFASKREEAAKSGSVLRYAAEVANGACAVGLTAVPKQSPLGALQGTDNLVEVRSQVYDPAPLVVQGRGAGTECTASGVLADVLELRDVMA